MKDPNRKVIYMLWFVIAALIIGSAVGGYLLLHKADDLTQTNEELTGNNASLREQLRQAKTQLASPSPSPAASPAATPSPTPSVNPSPSASPIVSPNPKR